MFAFGLFVPPRAVEFVVVVVALRRVEDRSGDEEERVNDQGRKWQFLNGWMQRVEGERESMGNEEGERERGREGEERLFEGPEDRWRSLRGKPDVSRTGD